MYLDKNWSFAKFERTVKIWGTAQKFEKKKNEILQRFVITWAEFAGEFVITIVEATGNGADVVVALVGASGAICFGIGTIGNIIGDNCIGEDVFFGLIGGGGGTPIFSCGNVMLKTAETGAAGVVANHLHGGPTTFGFETWNSKRLVTMPAAPVSAVSNTVWKSRIFPATQILREINFCDFSKLAIYKLYKISNMKIQCFCICFSKWHFLNLTPQNWFEFNENCFIFQTVLNMQTA